MLSVLNQTLKPDKFVIFDDNEDPKDLREVHHYAQLYKMLDDKGINWSHIWAEKKGQHYNHQLANKMGYTWVWRLDDDTIAEPNTLEVLYSHISDDAGAIGGSILSPGNILPPISTTGEIENIDVEYPIQMGIIHKKQEVKHLHCSFLYRAGIVDYCLSLSRVAHREETLFTYELHRKGYHNYVVPNAVTWHLKNTTGGIRDNDIYFKSFFDHDEKIFRNRLELVNKTIIVLDCGMGDHIVFKRVLPDVENPVIFSCYPNIIPGKSIAEAKNILGDLSDYNIYRKMDEWGWTGSLEEAFRKLYCEKT